MSRNIGIDCFEASDIDLEEIGKLYCITFIGKDYSFDDLHNVINNIRKHAGYAGFKGLKAKDENGKVVGFAYGYTSLPDQFYRQKIAAQLSNDQMVNWLNDCFEFVELAVDPMFKRLGIASKLHDALLDSIHHNTAILTTWIKNTPAINLYQSKGWEVIKRDVPVVTEDDLQVIMGKCMDFL